MRVAVATSRSLRQRVVAVTGAAAVAAAVLLSAYHSSSGRLPLLGLVGGGLGFVLFRATFGFAGSFRAALERRDFTGFRAQALALALTSIAFFPLLAGGQLFGLFESTGLPIQAIAESVGHTSRSYFTRAFRKMYGTDLRGFSASRR